MVKRIACLVLALAFCGSPAARAVNIIWVTESVDITGDGVPDDFAWIPWLQSLGHTVDVQRGNWTTLDNTKIAALNAADVIIISRSATSGDYNTTAAMISQWSGIKAPIICLHAYFVRNNRWFWVNTATINSLVGPMMEVVVPTHPDLHRHQAQCGQSGRGGRRHDRHRPNVLHRHARRRQRHGDLQDGRQRLGRRVGARQAVLYGFDRDPGGQTHAVLRRHAGDGARTPGCAQPHGRWQEAAEQRDPVHGGQVRGHGAGRRSEAGFRPDGCAV